MASEQSRELQLDAYLKVMRVLRKHRSGFDAAREKLVINVKRELMISEDDHIDIMTRLQDEPDAPVMRGGKNASTSKAKDPSKSKPAVRPPGPKAGMMGPGPGLQQLNPLIGKKVEAWWEDRWYKGIITDHNMVTGKYCVAYDAGTDNESFEWDDVPGQPQIYRILDEPAVDVTKIPAPKSAPGGGGMGGGGGVGGGGAKASSAKGGSKSSKGGKRKRKASSSEEDDVDIDISYFEDDDQDFFPGTSE